MPVSPSRPLRPHFGRPGFRGAHARRSVWGGNGLRCTAKGIGGGARDAAGFTTRSDGGFVILRKWRTPSGTWRYSPGLSKGRDISLKKIIDPAVRALWIRQRIDEAKKLYMDGINIDIEQRVKKMSSKYYALTALVKETTEAFHKEIPGSQVTFDVAWSPECVDHRCYNYSAIASSCDFLFVMSYDEQNQMWSHCVAAANAPYKQTISGYDNYIRLGINPKKLVMGVPWYGYDYPCLSLSEAHVCSLARFPFQWLLCPKTSALQVPYRTIMKRENNSLSGILWDEENKAAYVEYQDSSGTFHQVWFDNPKSIALKAAYVKEHGLRGIGMWNADCLDYSGDSMRQEQTEAMWEALIPE